MTTKVVIEDAEPIDIPAELAGDDQAIVAAITPYHPEIAEGAEIERETQANGDVLVKITPVGKTKG